MRLVSKNVGQLTGAELLCALWNRHAATINVDVAPPGGDETKDKGRSWRRRKLQLAAAGGGGGHHGDVKRTAAHHHLNNDDLRPSLRVGYSTATVPLV